MWSFLNIGFRNLIKSKSTSNSLLIFLKSTLSKTLSEPCIESLTFLRDVNDARIIYVNLEIKNPTEKSKVTKNFKVQKIIFADNVRSFVNG